MNFKKIFFSILLAIIIIAVIIVFIFARNKLKNDSNKIQVVTSNFACYDFLRAIVGDDEDIELTFLIGPGKDAHSYEPTSQDMIKIQNAKLFVYIGGESENWADKVIESIDNKKGKMYRITEYVDLIDEEKIDGVEEIEDEEEGSFDDHIWTSPSNAIKMVEALEKELEEINPDKKEIYQKNAENYILQIKEIDSKIREIVDNKKRDRLVFGDRMPMQYFINYYGLKVSAAFSGCSTDTEPSASTIAYLEKLVKENNIPVVLYIELNNGRVAKTIADETDSKALQIQTIHNVSLEDYNNGETWVSLMNRNIEVLNEALQ